MWLHQLQQRQEKSYLSHPGSFNRNSRLCTAHGWHLRGSPDRLEGGRAGPRRDPQCAPPGARQHNLPLRRLRLPPARAAAQALRHKPVAQRAHRGAVALVGPGDQAQRPQGQRDGRHPHQPHHPPSQLRQPRVQRGRQALLPHAAVALPARAAAVGHGGARGGQGQRRRLAPLLLPASVRGVLERGGQLERRRRASLRRAAQRLRAPPPPPRLARVLGEADGEAGRGGHLLPHPALRRRRVHHQVHEGLGGPAAQVHGDHLLRPPLGGAQAGPRE
mmetsp:Transcript_88070/g.234166  ORF Transcript_88070/g.234166 Transcript_88070/m.234166 type:complete len:275 (-) Transcript_88070:221-1045(-)